VPAVQKARDAGILVMALDTPLLIGQWARARMGDEAPNARIATLDLAIRQPSVDVLRNQGVLTGFGVELNDPNVIGDETDPRLVGSDVTQGNEEGGRRAMENLLAQDPMINVVHTINEPAAAGAHEALRAIGREKEVLIVSVDGAAPVCRTWPTA
jgi:fructose transport system substrate-binding protein